MAEPGTIAGARGQITYAYHTAATTAAQAAARIHALLHHAELDLTAAGYTAMLCHCIEPLRLPEVDRITNATWQHEGGQYELWSYPTS